MQFSKNLIDCLIFFIENEYLKLQHGGSTNAVGPAHCVPPKWLLPNIYKFYVLLHDLSADNDSRFFCI